MFNLFTRKNIENLISQEFDYAHHPKPSFLIAFSPVFVAIPTPRKNVCACVGNKKDGEEFKCQIVNKNLAI
jgi:hypothetical protein